MAGQKTAGERGRPLPKQTLTQERDVAQKRRVRVRAKPARKWPGLPQNMGSLGARTHRLGAILVANPLVFRAARHTLKSLGRNHAGKFGELAVPLQESSGHR